MMDALSRGVELARNRHALNAIINDLSEHDSVLLVVGYRDIEDGNEVSWVKTTAFNAHSFEARGLAEVAREQLSGRYTPGE